MTTYQDTTEASITLKTPTARAHAMITWNTLMMQPDLSMSIHSTPIRRDTHWLITQTNTQTFRTETSGRRMLTTTHSNKMLLIISSQTAPSVIFAMTHTTDHPHRTGTQTFPGSDTALTSQGMPAILGTVTRTGLHPESMTPSSEILMLAMIMSLMCSDTMMDYLLSELTHLLMILSENNTAGILSR